MAQRSDGAQAASAGAGGVAHGGGAVLGGGDVRGAGGAGGVPVILLAAASAVAQLISRSPAAGHRQPLACVPLAVCGCGPGVAQFLYRMHKYSAQGEQVSGQTQGG